MMSSPEARQYQQEQWDVHMEGMVFQLTGLLVHQFNWREMGKVEVIEASASCLLCPCNICVPVIKYIAYCV